MREVPTDGWPAPSYWIRVGTGVIAIIVGLLLVLRLQGVLLVVVASMVLALGMQPAIAWLEGRGLRRGSALALLLVVGAVAAGAGAMVIVPTVVNEIDGIVAALPQLREELSGLGGIGPMVAERLDPASFVADDDDEVTRTIGTVAVTIFNVVTVLVLTPYFAHAYPRMKVWVLRLVYREDRPDLLRLLNEAGSRISGYILGNLVVSVIAGVVTFMGFTLLGVDFALALALWVALTDLVPVVGAFMGAIPALAIAGREGLGPAVAVAVFLVGYQLFENYVVAPRVMTKAVDLSPAAVIVALMVGGTLAGVIGALLALPLAAMVKIATDRYVFSRRLEKVRGASDVIARGERRGDGRRRPLP